MKQKKTIFCEAAVILTILAILLTFNTVITNNSIYSDIGLNGKDNSNLSTILIRNIVIERKRLLNYIRTSEDSNPNLKWTR